MFVSQPDPVASFEQAIARVKAMQEKDNQDITRDVCVTKLTITDDKRITWSS